ncbi:beta-1,4-mannosyl-glycoprotein beta-1,4-N-acetylglucosaminyl-transferase, putative [Ixodes scapularis]|uniref:Beta-1,4-mannosyl-glycoprotein beta-1,4-N-acetylglucosaminyl-transferase, putative n=1 Tax=Ixodes scapularis TaxID=6945 RepID=B7P3A0_IXOSC|nr:beta-1,4-mannosyl-glycoprotein beta-1,4-N-acetylglucosaminyl-transferase, putative [Ixodes scapularis]|eukprot:XP_002403751.1 beta-1,4-mannosyl-glycoprotein beta-1,4-N-acetylglucosaminyl-transferase, putative [Ixodes scapularis]
MPNANGGSCFTYGTNSSVSNNSCVCLQGWNGDTCSVPQVLWMDRGVRRWYAQGIIKRRPRPRMIINLFMFNHEIDMLDIRIHVLGDAVDYYVVCESNYTFFGSPKQLYLSSNLSAGFLSEHRHKIVLLRSGFNYAIDKDHWAPENNLRSLLWKEGRHRFQNLRDDDLLMLNDADEIPSRELMLFLKYHDGYREPIVLYLRWFFYGFFWENYLPSVVPSICTVAYLREVYGDDSNLNDRPVIVTSVCTVGYLRDVYGDDSNLVRRNQPFRVIQPTRTSTGTVWNPWTIKGVSPKYAGWHCSWCFSISGIQIKLASSQRDDGIRWADFAEKHDPEYIRFLRREGRFFDESPPLRKADGYRAAPAYVVQEEKRWPYLLDV